MRTACLMALGAASAACGRLDYEGLDGGSRLDAGDASARDAGSDAADGAAPRDGAVRDPELCNPSGQSALCPRGGFTGSPSPLEVGGLVSRDDVSLPCGSGGPGSEWSHSITSTVDATYRFEVSFTAPAADVAFIDGASCADAPDSCQGNAASPVVETRTLRAGEPLIIVVDVVGSVCASVTVTGTPM